jgi:transposase
LDEIATLVETAAPDEVVVYEDDIHLNPKIGADWMLRGQQKEVPTPEKNEKRYLAGAQDVRTKELICVEGERKTSYLFLLLLWELVMRHPTAKKIHVILDNYGIPTSRLVQSSLQTPQGLRLEFHFLSPYCPDHNKIERTWQDLHANVSRNHKCSDMPELMKNVNHFIVERNRRNAAAI